MSAFTLMEVLIVVIVVGILAILLIAVLGQMRARAQRIHCMANLKNLYVAADLFVQQNGSWPQLRRSATSASSSEDFAIAWINALAPFGPSSKTWICPTMQESLDSPDYIQPENARLDYIPMLFDDAPLTAHEWPQAPWFVEAGNVHGNGNLIIFTDGSITDFNTIASQAAPPSP